MLLQPKVRHRYSLAVVLLSCFSVALLNQRDELAAVENPDQPVQLAESFEQNVLPVLEKYCYACPGNGEAEGSVALD